MKKQIRRYNFIAGTSLIYSGLFERVGLFGGLKLKWALLEKRLEVSSKYNLPLKTISISNTIKDVK